MDFLLLTNSSDHAYDFQKIRNSEYLRLLSKIYKGKYIGEVKEVKSDSQPFVMSHGEISLKQFKNLGISEEFFYGGAKDFSMPIKVIAHPLVPNPKVTPEDFPVNLVSYIDDADVSVPGYSVFSSEDAYTAYELICSSGDVPRLKDSLGSGTMGQSRLTSVNHLQSILESLTEEYINKNGILIESNILSIDRSVPPESMSVGIIRIGNDVYCYLGKMKLTEPGPFGYQGTRIVLKKGELSTYDYGDELNKKIIKMASRLERALSKSDSIVVGSRLNLDVIIGVHERVDGIVSETPAIYVNEIALDPGCATAAEFAGIKYLTEHKDVEYLQVSGDVEYAATGISTKKNPDYIFCDTLDSAFGRTKVTATIEKVIM